MAHIDVEDIYFKNRWKRSY